VLEANESGRVKGRASVAFQFNRIVVHGETHDLKTMRVTREAAADTKGDVKKGAIGGGVGAVVGGLIGGGKGAVIGGAAGGAGTVLATKGKEVQLPAGTNVTARLQEPLTVQVPTKER
jgi:outer membrane lipoprotein SlyB